MRTLSLRGRLLLALAYVLVLAVVALEVPLALSLRDRVDAEVTSQARSQADVVAATVSGNLGEPRTLAEAAESSAATVRGRVVVTDSGGALLADSAGTDRLDTDYGDRPEIAQAFRDGQPVQDQRHSDTSTRRSSSPRSRSSTTAAGSASCGSPRASTPSRTPPTA